ncbi:uncharacterized protein LOC122512631 [Leptopilina heterotoma]|uniref:uncharacterized protein LOC122512631 n=1 Tax=Leptopilina heterotoma TaxID=63436 RepID=UPI001CA80FF3|nr:uncharacterized protein LOC122512631 [Leptopilina heterotoma]XP_043484509.1 uncharacterized protein LOC122512631 [Leptopilina heterotoma]XP_043484510.1 uncharacterized protein LOC122512631 [Leptopilina heterotoma]XP_043484511.1 uncharacterized protein LOC122512631 [Leptopilina heterotoma]XP_043484512.1 uncharacterized protein LOC122512631 [Leptopilina heterotoma]
MFSEYDLMTLRKALEDSAQYMTREVKDEHVAICIGATRAGKSTLINYLIGNKLKAVRVTRVQPVTIVKADNESSGPEIGAGSTSKTTIPTRWTSNNLPDLVIWDAPGFDDNRGAVQDITNAFYLYQLVQNVKSLKVVLVVDINDILHDNIKHFLTVLKAVESLLGSRMKSLFSAISVIFTKVPNTLEDIPVDMQFINEKLTYQFLSSNDLELSQVSVDFVRYLMANNNQVAFFKRTQVADVTSAIDVNIFPVIKNSASILRTTLQELRPSISESSKLSLFHGREKLISKTSFTDLENAISALCQIKIQEVESLVNNNPETEQKIMNLKRKLTIIESKLMNAILYEVDFFKKLEILESIDIEIKIKIIEHNLIDKIKLMGFVDKLLDLEELTILALNVQSVLLSSVSKVKEAISLTSVKLGEITHQKHMEDMQQEQERHNNEIKDLEKKIQELTASNDKKKGFFKTLFKTVTKPIKDVCNFVDDVLDKAFKS